MNIKILNFIDNYSNLYTRHLYRYYYMVNKDIQTILLCTWNWRLCTAYGFIQKSSRGIRLLIYIDDKILHPGESFGTDVKTAINQLKKGEAIKIFQEELNNFNIDKFNIYNYNNKDKIINIISETKVKTQLVGLSNLIGIE